MTSAKEFARALEMHAPLWSKMEKKHRQNSQLIIHIPTSEGVSEVSKRVSAAEGASKACSLE